MASASQPAESTALSEIPDSKAPLESIDGKSTEKQNIDPESNKIKLEIDEMPFHPNPEKDRRRYQWFRFTSLFLVFLWILIPLHKTKQDNECNLVYSSTLDENQNFPSQAMQNLETFSFLWYFMYVVLANSVGWILIYLVLPLPSKKTMAIFITCISFLTCTVSYYILKSTQLSPRSKAFIFPLMLIICSGIPLFSMSFIYCQRLIKTSKTAHFPKIEMGLVSTSLTQSEAGKLYPAEMKILDEFLLDDTQVESDSDDDINDQEKNREAQPPEKQSNSVQKDAPLRTASVVLQIDKEHREFSKSEILNRFILILAMSLSFLFLYYFCQIFSSFFLALSLRLDGVERSLFQIIASGVFRFSMGVLGILLKNVAKKFPPQLARFFQPVTTYVSTLFFLLFFRNLFVAIRDYWTFFIIIGFQTFTQLVLFGVRPRIWWFNREQNLRNRFKHIPVLKAIFKPLRSREHFARRLTTDYFFDVIADFISLFSFTAFTPLLRFGYNQNFYLFNSTIPTEEDFNILLWFSFVMLIAMIIQVVSIRKMLSNAAGIDAFYSGARFIHRRTHLFVLIFITTHILSDVYLAVNSMVFCG